jgi:hypothetical protein
MSLRPHQFRVFKIFFEDLRAELASVRQAIQQGSADITGKDVAEEKAQRNEQEKIGHAIDNFANQQNKSSNAAESNQERRNRKNLFVQWVLAVATIAAFFAAAIYAYFAHLQLVVMEDTAGIAERQLTETRNAVDSNNSQVDRSMRQMIAQTIISERSANAAKSAAETANKALHVSERAYITIGLPTLDITTKYVTIPILNSGHIPSGKVLGVIHEAMMDVVDPTVKQKRVKPSESHWKHYELHSVPNTGQPLYFEVAVPNLNLDSLNGGRQQFVMVGIISYSDGFSDDPVQQWTFCEVGATLQANKSPVWNICDPAIYLPEVTKTDHYPDDEYQIPDAHYDR